MVPAAAGALTPSIEEPRGVQLATAPAPFDSRGQHEDRFMCTATVGLIEEKLQNDEKTPGLDDWAVVEVVEDAASGGEADEFEVLE